MQSSISATNLWDGYVWMSKAPVQDVDVDEVNLRSEVHCQPKMNQSIKEEGLRKGDLKDIAIKHPDKILIQRRNLKFKSWLHVLFIKMNESKSYIEVIKSFRNTPEDVPYNL